MAADEKLSLDEAQEQISSFKPNEPDPSQLNLKYVALHDQPQPFYESVNLMIADFNRLFIQTLIGNQPHVTWEHDNLVTYLPYEAFHKQFSYVKVANSLFGGDDKFESKIKPTQYWLDSPHKRSARGIKFYPAVDNPNDPLNRFYNPWKDWAVKPVYDRVKRYQARLHIYTVICNRDRRKFRHWMDFHAHFFQKPWERPSFGIANQSEEEGTGKSSMSEQIAMMVGRESSFKTSSPDHIFGKNNDGLSNCLYLSLEEVEWSLYKRYSTQFRDLFTTPNIPINIKYIPLIIQDNYMRININGNADQIAHLSRTSRRLTVFRTNPIYLGNTEYFGDFKKMMSMGGREALMYEFMNRDISKFDPFTPLHTRELEEQRELGLDTIGEFWLECLEEGKLPYEETRDIVREVREAPSDTRYIVIVEKLVWYFNEWARKHKGDRPITNKAFGKRFRKLVQEMPEAWKIKCGEANINEKRFNAFAINSLDLCRAHFAAYNGIKQKEWNNEVEWEQFIIDKHDWFQGF